MNRYLVLAMCFFLASCNEVSTDPRDRAFNIQFKYGVGARNELNTFTNYYTKDLIADGTTSITLVLGVDEFRAIEAKLYNADFFSYPDTFRVASSDTIQFRAPYMTYYFRVQSGAHYKTLYWEDSIIPRYSYPLRDNLKEITQFIIDLLSRKPEIANLPPAKGGYL